MNDLDWALNGAAYLQRARLRAGADFDKVVELFRGGYFVGRDWFEEGRASARSLHRLSHDLVVDAFIPGRSFGSPQDFGRALEEYETTIGSLHASMTAAVSGFRDRARTRPPYEAQELIDLLETQLAIVRYVRSTAPPRVQSDFTGRVP